MSKAIEELMHEHDAILFSLKILESMNRQMETGNAVDIKDVSGFLGFLKEFADTCHHGKEEGLLFPALVQAGVPEQGGPVGVMLSEHAQGREWIQRMEAAIFPEMDVAKFTKASTGYMSLLRSHINKENNVLFPMAERVLSAGQLDKLHKAFEEHEEKVIGKGRHDELHALLGKLKEKFPAE